MQWISLPSPMCCNAHESRLVWKASTVTGHRAWHISIWLGFWGRDPKETRSGAWRIQFIFDPFIRSWLQVMHPEAYLEHLASTKQVSDIKNIIRGSISLISLLFASIKLLNSYVVWFPISCHDCGGMKKTWNAIGSRSVQEIWCELCSGPVWWKKRCFQTSIIIHAYVNTCIHASVHLCICASIHLCICLLSIHPSIFLSIYL